MTRTLLIFLMLTFLTVYSYCVYNQMSDKTELFVYQDSGQNNLAHAKDRRFHHNMAPGSKECCPWDVGDCSRESNKDHGVSLVINYPQDGRKNQDLKHRIQCTAGGYVIVKGTYDQLHYFVYNADHQLS
ncbi:hypothetical protein BDC45DRAFT_530478 [Circinella umbellata]|nr:hypothetical protein BDC45DRAFT_530478 [Circinella umbellata]